jgi:ATP-binding cassette subfamily F protein uup
VHQPNVLFLDEPTNDLDIQTLNVLEQFLDHFRGCLVVVSHDRYFLDRNVDFLATFESGGLSSRYPGPYSNYQRRRAERQLEASQKKLPAQKKKQMPSKQTTRRGPRKLTWKETRELEALENQIATLEAEKTQLEQTINQTGADYQSLQTLAVQLQSLEEKLEEKMGRWLELSEIG